jgi:hypothetical protein
MGKHKSWLNMLLNKKKIDNFLPPEDKAQILNKDAAAHKKQCKCLPFEDKNQVLRNDAAAHKKQ